MNIKRKDLIQVEQIYNDIFPYENLDAGLLGANVFYLILYLLKQVLTNTENISTLVPDRKSLIFN